MCVVWKSDFERTHCQNLFWDRANPFFSAHDVSDFHGFIIEYDRPMIGRKSSDFKSTWSSTSLVLNSMRPRMRSLKTMVSPFGTFRRIVVFFIFLFFLWLPRSVYVDNVHHILVEAWVLLVLFWVPQVVHSYKNNNTLSPSQSVWSFWRIGIEPFTLYIRSIWSSVSDTLIWSKSKEIMHVKNSIHCTFHQTCTIVSSIYDILPIIVSCPKIGIERRSEIADVYRSSWWWSQSGADSHKRRI